MVYTLTFCPGLEYAASVDEISVGADNLISDGNLRVSGSGAIISQLLGELGVPSTVMGFAAGFTGGEVEEILRGRGVNTDIVYLEKGLSPLNMVLDNGEKLTRFSAGPLDISYDELMSLFARLERIKDGDALVLSGEVPPSIPADVYSFVPDTFAGKNVRVILDVPAEPLAKCLKLQPFLVVTDCKRLGEIFGEPPETEEQIIAYISAIQEMGAQNVLVFPGDDDIITLLDSDKNILRQPLPPGAPLDDIALNSLTAGFIMGCEDNDVDNRYSLILAASAARSAAIRKRVPSKSDVISVMKDLMKSHSY